MGTRTIGISDDAYERLAALKAEGESFSDVIRRITGAHLLRGLAGSMDATTADHYERTIAEARHEDDVARADRVKDLAGGE